MTMKSHYLLETVLAVVEWFLAWGLYLIFTGLLIVDNLFLESVWWQQVSQSLNHHPELMVGLMIGWFVLYLGAQVWHGRISEHNRRIAYQQWANQHHWSYSPGDHPELYQRYGFLYGIPGYRVRSSSLQNAHIIDALTGKWRGYTAKALTYHSSKTTSHNRGGRSRSQVTHYYLAITLIEVDHHFPKVYIRPADWSDQVAKFLGLKPEEPGEVVLRTKNPGTRYCILTSNQQFAQQFLQLELIELAFQRGVLKFEIDRNVLAIYQTGRLKPAAVEANLECLHQIYQRISPQWKR